MSDLPTRHANVEQEDLGYEDVVRDMYQEKAVQDRQEVDAGLRFYDTGTRIPGQQKAKNDNYMKKRK